MVYALDVQLSKSRVIYRKPTNEFKKFTDGVFVTAAGRQVFTFARCHDTTRKKV